MENATKAATKYGMAKVVRKTAKNCRQSKLGLPILFASYLVHFSYLNLVCLVRSHKLLHEHSVGK